MMAHQDLSPDSHKETAPKEFHSSSEDRHHRRQQDRHHHSWDQVPGDVVHHLVSRDFKVRHQWGHHHKKKAPNEQQQTDWQSEINNKKRTKFVQIYWEIHMK